MRILSTGDGAGANNHEDEYEPGYSDEADGEIMTPLEKAADLLRPGVSFNNILASLAVIPLPIPSTGEECVICDAPSEMQGDKVTSLIFSPSEMALLDLSHKNKLTRAVTKQVIALIKSRSFKASEISSDIFAKVEQAIHDQHFQVEIMKVKFTLSKSTFNF